MLHKKLVTAGLHNMSVVIIMSFDVYLLHTIIHQEEPYRR